MNRLLYIEDDQEIGNLVFHALNQKGYEVKWLKSGNNFQDHLESVDLIILDVMLPGLDGFTIGGRIRELTNNIPIIYLTALSTIEDKINGLENADDYMTKPFDPRELIIRIEKLLKRYEKVFEYMYNVKHLKIDLNANQIINSETNEEISLTGIQYRILSYLLKNNNQILTKEQIYNYVWKDTYMEGDKVVNVHIKYLREKIEKNPKKPKIVETIRGLGYRIKL
ncbi:response regulator transcription factor [Bacillus cereus group sp. BfR-BA-01380]|uniref:response regulator transcription factor n=1 Tax=Bacillus cereus group sp. BfR-BA-01380 TaxID=2920324 RepID=UPI001F5A18A9|nr:response regulator transcription factor [Bacillus cereus group sp. BfR-BA-01380]